MKTFIGRIGRIGLIVMAACAALTARADNQLGLTYGQSSRAINATGLVFTATVSFTNGVILTTNTIWPPANVPAFPNFEQVNSNGTLWQCYSNGGQFVSTLVGSGGAGAFTALGVNGFNATTNGETNVTFGTVTAELNGTAANASGLSGEIGTPMFYQQQPTNAPGYASGTDSGGQPFYLFSTVGQPIDVQAVSGGEFVELQLASSFKNGVLTNATVAVYSSPWPTSVPLSQWSYYGIATNGAVFGSSVPGLYMTVIKNQTVSNAYYFELTGGGSAFVNTVNVASGSNSCAIGYTSDGNYEDLNIIYNGVTAIRAQPNGNVTINDATNGHNGVVVTPAGVDFGNGQGGMSSSISTNGNFSGNAATATTATNALNWSQVMPTTNGNQIAIYTNSAPGQMVPPNVIGIYTYCLTNASLGYALFTNNLPISTNALAYFPDLTPPQLWYLAPSNEIAQGLQDAIAFAFTPTNATLNGPWTDALNIYPATMLYATNTFSDDGNGQVQYADGAGYAVTAGIAADSSNAGIASAVFGPVIDVTNFNAAEWIANVGSRINEFESVGRYTWTNTMNAWNSGHQVVVENDGCGYGFEYTFGLLDLLFANNHIPFAGAIVPTGNFPWNGGGFYFAEFTPHFGPLLSGTPGGYHDASQQYFYDPPLDGICVTNGGGVTITNNSWPWNVCVWSYYTSPDGGAWSVQTNNLAASSTWTQIASGTSLASTTNLVFGAWTNAAGASTNVMFRFIETGGVGTNRTAFFGYENTNLFDGVIYQDIQNLSMSVANMLGGSTFAMSNTEAALWKFSAPTLDIYNDANGDSATNLWPTWFSFAKSQIKTGDLVAMESYLGSDGQPAQGTTNNFITLRQDCINAHVAFYDGTDPCVSTNLMWYYGLGLGVSDWHEDPYIFRPSAYWFYKWMNLQDAFR